MADAAPSRRSARGCIPNKRYTNDAFEGLDLQGTALVSSSSSESSSESIPQLVAQVQIPRLRQGQSESELEGGDQEFANVEIASSSSEGETLNNELAHDKPSLDDHSNTVGQIQGLQNGRDSINSADLDTDPPVVPAANGGGSATEKIHGKSQGERLRDIVGSEPENLQVYLKNYKKWYSEDLLPTRLPNERGSGGFGYPFRAEGESRERDSARAWNWYYEAGGQHTTRRRQGIRYLTKEEASEYYPKRHQEHLILMGPYGRQQEVKLALNAAVHLRRTWPQVSNVHADGPRQTLKDGWLLNLGSRIRCLAWAPNHSSSVQYLAVAFHNNPPHDHPRQSAFAPSLPWKSSIEIWAFTVDYGHGGTGYVSNSPPRLVHSICSSWAQPRQLKWCPTARFPRSRTGVSLVTPEPDDEGNISIGLLAIISTDGHARVIDVRVPSSSNHDVNRVYSLYTAAAFTAKHPDRVCTTLTWRSDRELVVGLSSGEIAVWDISQTIETLSPSPYPELRIFINHLYASWPLSLICLNPAFPNILVGSSLSGHVFMIDLDNPHGDVAQGPRSRLPITSQVWSEGMLGLLQVEDEQVVFRTPRMWAGWGNMIVVMKSQITCLSVGVGHMVLLVGGADGECVV